MNTIHSHSGGRANKLRSDEGVVGENDVGIITFRNEVWDERIHAPYHPRRGTQQTRRRPVGRAFCVQHRRLFTHISYVLPWILLREARWRTNYACTCAPETLHLGMTDACSIPMYLICLFCRVRVMGIFALYMHANDQLGSHSFKISLI